MLLSLLMYQKMHAIHYHGPDIVIPRNLVSGVEAYCPIVAATVVEMVTSPSGMMSNSSNGLLLSTASHKI